MHAPAGGTGLSDGEIRVLGCLLEKQRTTPDAYPLSLNALRLACNQSTNRDPVVDYDEAIVRDALHRLERRGYIRLASSGRAAKYRHLLAERLPLDGGEQALISVLMLRGPQTPGELKQRAERMHQFADLAAVHETLAQLIERELVLRLERRPGQKEERYRQLLGEAEGQDEPAERGESAAPSVGSTPPSTSTADAPSGSGERTPRGPDGSDELGELRERVERLEKEVAELRAAIRHPSPSPLPSPSHDPRRFDPRL
jgi:uncharacterized protein YceH (UPF0502 family)